MDTAERRIAIERIDADGNITKGTARARGVTLDDFRSLSGTPLNLPPGASFVIPMVAFEPASENGADQ